MKAKNKRPKEVKEPGPKKRKLRVPRPLGITALCKELNQKGLDQETNPSHPPNKDLLRKRIHQLYIQAFMNHQLIEYDHITKQNRLISLNRLAYLLNQGTTDIMTMIAKEMSRMGLIMDRHKAELARGATLGLIFEASELSALTAQQTAILMASQGGRYTPFVSGEVNRAIANQIAATKPKLDLIKLLLDGKSGTLGPTNPIQPTGTQKGTYMTIEMAHNMLNDGPLTVMSDEHTRTDILLNSNDLKLLPETNPNYQGGDILRSSSLYVGSEEELKSVEEKGDHTTKNRAKQGLTEVEDEDEFRA